MRIRLTVSALLVMAALPVAAHAAVANFTFSGLDTGSQTPYSGTSSTQGPYTSWQGGIDSGTISFTYAGAPATLGLSDITSFSITRTLDQVQEVTYASNPTSPVITDYGVLLPNYHIIVTYTQSLSSLTNFSATVGADGTVTALNFSTTAITPAGGWWLYPNSLQGSGTGGVLSYDSTTTSTSYPSGIFTSGAITQVVPEPASIGLLAAGALGMMARRRRV